MEEVQAFIRLVSSLISLLYQIKMFSLDKVINTLVLAITLTICIIILYYFISFGLELHKRTVKNNDIAEKLKKRTGKTVLFSRYEQRFLRNVIFPEDIQTGWDSVCVHRDVVSELKRNVILPIMMKDELGNSSLPSQARPPKGILFTGAPGVGKTLLAKVIAKETNCTFLSIQTASIYNMWLGESEKIVKALFTLAEKLEPSIIFLDECDAILSSRNGGTYDHSTNSIKGTFLGAWDGFKTDKENTNQIVIVMGATNRASNIDPAFLRRLDLSIEISLPAFEDRMVILEILLKGIDRDGEFNLKQLASITNGFSGADLKEVVRHATMNCLPELREKLLKEMEERVKTKSVEASETNESKRQREESISQSQVNNAAVDTEVLADSLCEENNNTTQLSMKKYFSQMLLSLLDFETPHQLPACMDETSQVITHEHQIGLCAEKNCPFGLECEQKKSATIYDSDPEDEDVTESKPEKPQLVVTMRQLIQSVQHSKLSRRKTGAVGGLDEFEMTIASNVIQPNELGVTWKNIAGLNEVIGQIKRNVIIPIMTAKHRKSIKSELVICPKGVLLHGPPGTGKTMIAKAMAYHSRCTFINLDVSILQNKYYGDSQKLTSALFRVADKYQPTIIFIDEIDSILRQRDSQDHEVTATMKAQFLSLWDGMLSDPDKIIIIMGATNRPDDIDPAVMRRLTHKFKIPLPDSKNREKIFQLILRKESVAPSVNFEVLAALTEGFSPSELKDVACTAAINSLKCVNPKADALTKHKSLFSLDAIAVDSCRSIAGMWAFFENSCEYIDSSSDLRVGLILREITMDKFVDAIGTVKNAKTGSCDNNNQCLLYS